MEVGMTWGYLIEQLEVPTQTSQSPGPAPRPPPHMGHWPAAAQVPTCLPTRCSTPTNPHLLAPGVTTG